MDERAVYVIRIYRQDCSGIDGVIEAVVSGELLPFHTSEELWTALHHLPAPRRRGQRLQHDEELGS